MKKAFAKELLRMLGVFFCSWFTSTITTKSQFRTNKSVWKSPLDFEPNFSWNKQNYDKFSHMSLNKAVKLRKRMLSWEFPVTLNTLFITFACEKFKLPALKLSLFDLSSLENNRTTCLGFSAIFEWKGKMKSMKS